MRIWHFMSAMSLRQLMDFVPIFFIYPLLRFQFVPSSRLIFQLRFLLKRRLHLFWRRRRAFNDGTPGAPVPPVNFPPFPESEKEDCDHDNWDYDADSFFFAVRYGFPTSQKTWKERWWSLLTGRWTAPKTPLLMKGTRRRMRVRAESTESVTLVDATTTDVVPTSPMKSIKTLPVIVAATT